MGSANITYNLDVQAPQVAGSGLDDITPAITAYTFPHPRDYAVVINTAGGTDTFDWYYKSSRITGVNTDPLTSGWSLGASGVSMTGGALTLNGGVTITWAANTGHTATDEWRFKAARPAIHPQTSVFHIQNIHATLKVSIAPNPAVTRDATLTGGWALAAEEVMTTNWSRHEINRLYFVGTANTVLRIWEEGI